MCSSACELPFWQRTHGLGDQDCRGLSTCIESIGKFPGFFIFSRKLDRKLHRRTNASCSPLHGTIYRADDLTMLDQ